MLQRQINYNLKAPVSSPRTSGRWGVDERRKGVTGEVPEIEERKLFGGMEKDDKAGFCMSKILPEWDKKEDLHL